MVGRQFRQSSGAGRHRKRDGGVRERECVCVCVCVREREREMERGGREGYKGEGEGGRSYEKKPPCLLVPY